MGEGLTAAPGPVDEGRSTRSGRGMGRFVVGALVVAGVVAISTLALRADGPVMLEESFPADYVGPVWLTMSGDARDYAVSLEWGRLSTSFTHTGPRQETYFFDRGTAVYGRSGPLMVTVDPEVEVDFGFGPEPPGGINIGGQPWAVADAEPVGDNVPAEGPGELAEGVVDETITYGLVVEGVSVWDQPTRDGERVTMVRHGERYDARCWTEGQLITNSNLADPSDDDAAYDSTIWWFIDTPEGSGYIPDAWFARDQEDLLGLDECPDSLQS